MGSNTSTSVKSSRSAGKLGMTAGEVLQVRVQELTEEIPIVVTGQYDGDTESESSLVELPLSLGVCGLIPCGVTRMSRLSRTYQRLVLATALMACAGLLVEIGFSRLGILSVHTSCARGVCLRQRGLMSEGAVALSVMLGLVILCVWRDSSGLVNTLCLVQSYAHQESLTEKIHKFRRWEMWLSVALWIVAMCWCVGSLLYDIECRMPTYLEVLSLVAQLLVFGFLLCVCYCLLYICRTLTACVDSFCCNVVDDLDLEAVVHDWNVLQAVLRKSSGSIEMCFIAVHVGAVTCVPLLMIDFFALGADWFSIPSLVPTLFVCAGVLRLFFLAAAITDKCSRVPPLVNSLHFGPGTERSRQYIVEYIKNSAAGFYVFDVGLTTAMALKFMYIWGVVAFGLGTQLLARG